MQNPVRYKSGRYYARTFGNGKEIWESLRTSHFSVAKARLAEFLREHREKQANGLSEASAKMTFGQALKIHQQNQSDDVTIKPSARRYWNQKKVFRVREAQRAINRAARKVGMACIVHHDLRHLFATICIENSDGFTLAWT